MSLFPDILVDGNEGTRDDDALDVTVICKVYFVEGRVTNRVVLLRSDGDEDVFKEDGWGYVLLHN